VHRAITSPTIKYVARKTQIAPLSMHEDVALYDCHLIRSVIRRLFSGVLPELGVGTDDRHRLCV
jgi:N-formylglutamate amidohydrolase